MKKTVGIVLCLVVVCGAGLYFLMQKKSAGGQYARCLPQDVVATLNLTHVNTLADGFAASALGRFAAKDAVHAMMQEMGAEAKSLAGYDRLYDSIAGVTTNPAFRAVFGEDATAALLTPDMKVLAEKPDQALRASLVVVAQTSAAGALDLFSRLLTGASVSRETVDGLELTKVTVEPNQVIYGYADGKTVLLAYAPAAIKLCVATAKGDTGLDKAPAFQEALGFWQPAPPETTYSRMYLNVARMAELLKTSTNVEIRQSGEMLQGVNAMYSYSYAAEQGMESRARSTYRYEQLHEMVKSAVDAASASNQSLRLLQEKTLAYNWASSLRPEMIVKAMTGKKEEYQQIDGEVRRSLGVSLEELGRAFGPQYGGVLDDIVRTALFPAPKLTFFVGVRDRKIAETVLNGLRRKIAETGMAAEEQTQAAGQTLYSWPVLPDEAAQPTAALTDSMLYLATSKQAVKDALESKAAPDALAQPVAQQLGPELAGRMGKANFGAFVVYPQRMSRQTGEMIDWLGGILATTKNISISRLNRELVQLLQSAELIAATSNLTRERADWSMTVRKAQPQPSPAAGK